MKKNIFAIPVILLLFAAGVLSADCVIPGGINIRNETGVVIQEIYIAHADTGDWSKNILETKIEHGKLGAIPFDRSAVPRVWDVKAVDAKGKELHWNRLALYNIYDLKLLKDGKTEYIEIKTVT
ncbi:hypothetical protein LJC40_04190 [Synergistaceae bacterium OttesenSCG-928-D05]|nr:hypothetical protein [Synergistaceae bacterium OttesenSCG-928-D05]